MESQNEPTLIEQARLALREGRLPEAEAIAKEAINGDPDSALAHAILSQIYAKLQQIEPAIEAMEKADELRALDAPGLRFLTSLYWHSGNFRKAADTCQRLVAAHPSDGQAINSLAMCFMALRDWDRATRYFRQAVTLIPDSADLRHNLAGALDKTGSHREAITEYQKAIELKSDLTNSIYNLADLHFRLANTESTEDVFARDSEDLDEEVTKIFTATDHLKEASTLLDALFQIEPKHARARTLMASVLQQEGRNLDSIRELETAIESDPNLAQAYAQLARSKRIAEGDNAIVTRMELMLAEESRSSEDLALLHSALGKAYDDLGQYEKALFQFDKGHQVARALSNGSFDREGYRTYIDAVIAMFSPSFVETHRTLGMGDDLPVFVVGMPRSGTTLIEQILSSHSEVTGAGELPFWSDLAPKVYDPISQRFNKTVAKKLDLAYLDVLSQYGGASLRVVDKNPYNKINVGLLHILFPNARFIYCKRNAIGNCLSIYMAKFRFPPAYVHDREDLVFAYKENERLAQHWKALVPKARLMEVNYEDVVGKRKVTTKAIIEFCGLKWDEVCLFPERNERLVQTASVWQVRQPVYATSVAKWKNYEPWLGAFLELA